ncbi:MAG: hypothetical protein KC415_17060 [Anaerolineales bacterium]|nr:hypothetical protein [Anaerolineales bacterium]
MLKKIILVLLLLILLAAGVYFASENMGINIPVVSDLIDQIKPSNEAAETAVPSDPASNFTPNQDGYQFYNYSSRYPEGNLTVEDARAMFGDAVCTRIDGDTCIPHPNVLTWIKSMNETMNDVGHCVGFTVSSNQLYAHVRSVTELGADTTFALEHEEPVLRTISQAYASYYASNVWPQEVTDKTPTEIVEALLALDAPADIGIYYPKYGRNGHSILGYNVIDQGDGIYHIAVYDSNRPGEDNVIVVDTNKDTWFYAQGAVNPDQPSGDYQGDADSFSLTYVPISAYNEPLACPAEFAELCPDSPGKGFSVLTIFGRGQALAETADGSQIGQSGDTLVNTVEDGRFVPVRGELYSRQPPIMLIPSAESFTLQAQANEADEPMKLTVSNPTYSVVVDGLIGQPGQIEQLAFDPVTQQVSFVAGGTQRPSIQFVFNQGGAVYTAQVLGLEFEAGQDLTVTVDAANGDLQLTSNDLAVDEVVILVARLTADDEAVFASQEAAVSSDFGLALDLDNWDGVGAMTFLVDDDGDGTYETDVPVPNEPVANVLGTIGVPEAIMGSLQNTLPYLNANQTSDIAATLPTLGFTGAELGQTYQALPSAQPDDLAGALALLDLPPSELGNFTVALRLDPTETTILLDDLGLTDEVKTAVEAAITARQNLLDTLAEWEFLNPPDDGALPDFLAEQGLSDDQADEFVALVEPPPPPTATDEPVLPAVNAPEACSSDNGAAVAVQFVNETSGPVRFIWVGFDCNETDGTVVAPGESIGAGRSYGNHVFIARNEGGQMIPLDTPNGVVYTYIIQTTGIVVITAK